MRGSWIVAVCIAVALVAGAALSANRVVAEKQEAPVAAEVKDERAVLGFLKQRPTEYVLKEYENWKTQGRFVGTIWGKSSCVVEVADKQGYVELIGISDNQRCYILKWLQPGTYTIRISAPGCKPLVIEKTQVRAGYDLRIDAEFVPEPKTK